MVKQPMLALAILAGLVLSPSLSAKISPEEAQRLLEEADRHIEQKEPSGVEEERPDRRLATTFAELNPATQSQLKEYAAHCMIINDNLWSSETLSDREKQTIILNRRVNEDLYRYVDEYTQRNGFVDPYETRDAPNYIRFRDGHTSMNRSSAINWTRDELINAVPGVREMRGEVMQVLDDGLLVRTNETTWHVETNTVGIVEDDVVSGLFKHVGTYEYISVLGASMTIRGYEPFELDVDLTPVDATGEDVFDYLTTQGMDYLPIYRPRWEVDESPSFGWRADGVSGQSRSSSARNLESRGIYHWEWRRIEKPLNLYAQDN